MNDKVFAPDKLRQAIEKRGWTVTRFCLELGIKIEEPISQARVYNWLRADNKPDKLMVLAFAELFGEPINYFYKESN